MGIVVKQASISAVLSYLGVGIGFVNVALLMTKWFTPEEFGLRSILLDISVIYTILAQLGTYRGLVKFFPFFNDTGKRDNGLFTIGLLISLIGFLLVGTILILLKDQLVLSFNEKSILFAEYFWAIFPLSFLLLYNNVFESYLQARTQTAFSTFLKDVFNRLVFTLLLILFHYEVLTFYWFIVCFIFTYGINILIFIIYLKSRGELSLRINKSFFPRRLRKVYVNYSLFSILSGISGILITKIDVVMVGFILGLTSTAVYSMAVYLSALIYIPAIAVTKISLPILSRDWKAKRIDKIDELYKKSSINQLIVGGSLFILLWCSVDNLFALQREQYALGKMALLLLGISRVINMSLGVNGPIINISKFYRFDTLTSFFLALITIVTNLIFIPKWGIEGAAFATLLSLAVFNLGRFIYVYVKIGIQPFTWKTIQLLFILSVAFLVGQYLPHLDNIYLDTIYRSLIIIILVGVPVLGLKISDDINRIYRKGLRKAGL